MFLSNQAGQRGASKSRQPMLRLLPALMLAATLGACGGGSSSSSSIAPPTVSITSPAEGSQITSGIRSVSIIATVTPANISATLNGTAIPAADISRAGNQVTVQIALGNNANTFKLTATDSAGQATTETLTLGYPFLAFGTKPDASLVIGQPDFTTTLTAATTPAVANDKRVDGGTTFNPSFSSPLVHQGAWYLPDPVGSRIMVYRSPPVANDAAADFVIGQANFNGINAGQLGSLGSSVAAHGNRLLVSDRSDAAPGSHERNRVLIFDPIPSASGAIASVAIGQPDLTNTSAGCSATQVKGPQKAFVVNDKLIVVDTGNHRVLLWDTVPTSSGIAADRVLGQSNFTDCAPKTASNKTMNGPGDVWSDGQRLLVADTKNHRILIWNTFPTSDFAPADAVLGQTDFTSVASSDVSSVSSASNSRLSSPQNLSANGNQLFVADTNNRRVLIWDTIPTTSADNGLAADRVIGQADFTARASNAGLGVHAGGFAQPHGIAVDGKRLIVADIIANKRYLVFTAPD